MNPGRDLDSLIATKVFGMKVYPEGNWVAGPVFKIEPAHVGFMNEISVPHYSTDIKDAWDAAIQAELFSKLGQYLWYNGDWCVGDTNGVNDCLPHVKAKTAAHAICLAALEQ